MFEEPSFNLNLFIDVYFILFEYKSIEIDNIVVLNWILIENKYLSGKHSIYNTFYLFYYCKNNNNSIGIVV